MPSTIEVSEYQAINPHLSGLETQSFLILSKISEQKEFLKAILYKYAAKKPEDIEKMIESNKIKEHPAYEDFLSAISYEQNIKDLKKMLNNIITKI